MNFYTPGIAFLSVVIILHLTCSSAQDLAGSVTIKSTDPNDVHFYLYTNPLDVSDFDELKYNDVTSVTNSRFNSSNPIIIMSHGFTQNYTSQFPRYVRDAYLAAGYALTSNIIAVDWGFLSSPMSTIDVGLFSTFLDIPVYAQAVSNVYVVGKRVQEFISFLQANSFISNGDSVHLVGQSLGAHVSGMAGHYYQVATGTLLNRITGTDPAGPGFDDVPSDHRLDASDAAFVDIIHTNEGGFGYAGSLGHVDFIINNGVLQLDCFSTLNDAYCSHNLAPRYYVKSLSNTTIKGCSIVPLLEWLTPCTPVTEITFGENCPRTARGTYYVSLSL